MNSMFQVTALAVIAASYVGCATAQDVSEADFVATREAVRQGAAGFNKAAAGCVANLRRNPTMIEMSAQLTGAPQGRGPEVYCDRLMKAWRSGRYTYKMYVTVGGGSKDPEYDRILQGR